ncbi:hypothetical protein ACEQPO_14790 [Bacillus sp. SL00103]
MLDQNHQIVGVHNAGYSNGTINGGPKATATFVEFINNCKSAIKTRARLFPS